MQPQISGHSESVCSYILLGSGFQATFLAKSLLAIHHSAEISVI